MSAAQYLLPEIRSGDARQRGKKGGNAASSRKTALPKSLPPPAPAAPIPILPQPQMRGGMRVGEGVETLLDTI